MNVDKDIAEWRLKSWIMEGVELELEMAKLDSENKQNMLTDEDVTWNNKRIRVIQDQLELVNERIEQWKVTYGKSTR